MATSAPPKGPARDGKAVNVLLTSTVVKNDLVYAQGWLGIAGSAGVSDDSIALAIDMREYVIDVGAGLSPSVGDTIWVGVTTLTGHLPTLSGWATSSGSNRIRAFRVVTAKDTNNLCHAIFIGGLGLL